MKKISNDKNFIFFEITHMVILNKQRNFNIYRRVKYNLPFKQ